MQRLLNHPVWDETAAAAAVRDCVGKVANAVNIVYCTYATPSGHASSALSRTCRRN